MITFDEKNKQILTPLCQRCPEEYFRPENRSLPHVGCCSYSPVFTLFEIHQMVKANQFDIFLNEIYHHERSSIRPYEVVVQAYVHPSFYEWDVTSLTTIEQQDKKITYSVCPYFVKDKGCGLVPSNKPSICRSFICSTVEEKLEPQLQENMQQWVRAIRREVISFNKFHQSELEKHNWDLIDHLDQVIQYLSIC